MSWAPKPKLNFGWSVVSYNKPSNPSSYKSCLTTKEGVIVDGGNVFIVCFMVVKRTTEQSDLDASGSCWKFNSSICDSEMFVLSRSPEMRVPCTKSCALL